jgi:CheY-like chemotaxis protein
VTEVVNLNEIVQDYLASPEHEKILTFYPHVLLKTELSTDLMNISGSPAHLTKTLMNLVINAFEATKERDDITISTENCYIDAPVKGYDMVNEGDYVALSIVDTGAGISPEDMNHIFEPFYTKKKMGRSGTGLGMAVVWGVVKDHHGYIDFESDQGQGSRFTLYFPVTREPVKQSAGRSLDTYRGRDESILVVDDVQEQREIAAAILSELGYAVTTVSSGEEAVDYLDDHAADLIVLDMIMEPGMDGLDTFREILRRHPDQKAIIASGFSETERIREVRRLGASHMIKKPYTIEKIGVTIRAALHRD